MSIKQVYGGVVISGGHQVLLREPANHFGGYAWTFAKTTITSNIQPERAALLALQEKTGYEGSVRAEIPGSFKSSDGLTRYFLMDAKHPPAPHNWQTSRLRWARLSEARELIRQSSNEIGRVRDLAVLDAAFATAKTIKNKLAVQPEDFLGMCKPMPPHHVILPTPGLRFDAKEMAKIQLGLYPADDDQKWFHFFSGSRLRIHRRSSGALVFDVGFRFDPQGGAHVSDVVINKDREQYPLEADLTLMKLLIRSDLLEPPWWELHNH